jgi:hypothetical protein
MIEQSFKRLEELTDDNGNPFFKHVGHALEVAQAMDKQLQTSPVAYVVEVEETPGEDYRDTGSSLQNMNVTVGILIGIRGTGRSDQDRIALKVARKKVRESLYGFQPESTDDGDFEPLRIGRNNMQRLSKNQLFWMDRFVSEQTIESKN